MTREWLLVGSRFDNRSTLLTNGVCWSFIKVG